MDKRLQIWITVLEQTKKHIIKTIKDDDLVVLDALIGDIKLAKIDAARHIRPCDRCDNKFMQDLTCKQCAYTEHPEDTTI